MRLSDRNQKGFARYCPTFSRGFACIGEGIRKSKIRRKMKRTLKGDTEEYERKLKELGDLVIDEKKRETMITILKTDLESGDREAQGLACRVSEEVAKNGADLTPLLENLGEILYSGDELIGDFYVREWTVEPLTIAISDQETRKKTLEMVKELISRGKDKCSGVAARILINGTGDKEYRKEVLDFLIEGLSDESEHVREYFALVLEKTAEYQRDIGPAVRRLAESLDDRNDAVKKRCFTALGFAAANKEDMREALPFIAELLGDPFSLDQEEAGKLLFLAAAHGANMKPVIGKLMDAFSSEDADVVKFAAMALREDAGNWDMAQTVDINVRIHELLNSGWFIGESIKNTTGFTDMINELGRLAKKIEETLGAAA